jgi:hypothetical protein
MVFGQSRQEDLITYLLAMLPQQECAKIVAELQIDLSPTNRKRWNADAVLAERVARQARARRSQNV